MEYNRFEIAPPTFVDVNGDSSPEILFVAEADVDDPITSIAYKACQLQAFSFMPVLQRGTRLASFGMRSTNPIACARGTACGLGTPGVAVADLDLDGTNELIFSACDGTLYCTDLTGAVRWSVDVAKGLASVAIPEPVVADLDGDGSPEVIVASSIPAGGASNPWFMVINAVGTVIFQAQLSGAGSGNGIGAGGLSVVDRLGNGQLSVLVSTFGGTIVYDVASATPSSCAHWPVQRGGAFRRGQRDYEVPHRIATQHHSSHPRRPSFRTRVPTPPPRSRPRLPAPTPWWRST